MRILFCLWALQAFAAFNLTWGTPAISLDTNPPIGDTDSNARISIDPGGNAVATWSRTTGNEASEEIWAASYNHSLRVWTGAIKISGEGSSANPQTVIDDLGNAIFVWEEGFPTRIYSRTLSAEGVWSPDLSMPPTSVKSAIYAQTLPQLAVDEEGNALAIWLEYMNGKAQVFSASKAINMSWNDLGMISSGNQNALLIPSKALSMNASGDSIAVWQETSEESTEIHAAIMTSGSWSAPIAVSESNATAPSAGIAKNGDGVIAWSENQTIYSKTIVNGALSSAALRVSDPTYRAERPHVGIDEMGNALVVFERYNSIHKFIAGASLIAGASNWSSPTDISGPSPSDAAAAGYPVFSMNSIGDGVVIWKEWTGSNMIIQGAGYSVGTWSFIKTLSQLSANSGALAPSYDIAVTINDAGNMLAIWPEDPQGTGAQQIKATAGVGLANAGPTPPTADPITIFDGIATGYQCVHRFPAHVDMINMLSWSSNDSAAHFNVYRNNLSTLIGTTTDFKFEDHQRIPKQAETYLITSVDHNGQESGPMTIVVDPN